MTTRVTDEYYEVVGVVWDTAKREKGWRLHAIPFDPDPEGEEDGEGEPERTRYKIDAALHKAIMAAGDLNKHVTMKHVG